MANTNLTVRKGQCINFGNCTKANAKEEIEVNLGDDFICPECEGGLIEIQKKSGEFSPVLKWILTIVIILAVLGAGGYFGWKAIPCGWKQIVGIKCTSPVEEQTEIYVPNPPQEISLNKNELTLNGLGARNPLTAIIPEEADEDKKTIIWKSSDTIVCVVDNNGIVTAVADGNAVVSAYLLNGISAECAVTVEGTGKEAKDNNDKDGNGTESISNNGNSSSSSGTENGDEIKQTSITVSGGTYKGKQKNGQPNGMGTIYYTSCTVIRERPKQSIAEAGDYLVGDFRNGSLLQGMLYDKNGNQKEKIIIGGGSH
jgi:hypothetical protein